MFNALRLGWGLSFDMGAHLEQAEADSDVRTPELSVVSPVYMGEQSVSELVDQVEQALARISLEYEIILVEDGSPDDSWRRIQDICRGNVRVKGIQLSRNFGQHYALTAGLRAARGNYVIVMDCDLQDDPRYIPDLYEAAQQGYEIVYTRKRARAHHGIKNFSSRLFHKFFNLLVGNVRLNSQIEVGNYSLLQRRIVDAFLEFNDYHRHYLGILRWLGFSSTYVDVEHRERRYGVSSYTFSKLMREAVQGITSQTDRLLHLSIAVGLFCFITSLFAAVYIIVAYFLHGFLEGWASVAVLILSSTGIILMSLGVTAIYVGKIFEQSKGRPLYLIRERLNFKNDEPATD